MGQAHYVINFYGKFPSSCLLETTHVENVRYCRQRLRNVVTHIFLCLPFVANLVLRASMLLCEVVKKL